jgi:hypothetical protein
MRSTGGHVNGVVKCHPPARYAMSYRAVLCRSFGELPFCLLCTLTVLRMSAMSGRSGSLLDLCCVLYVCRFIYELVVEVFLE